ncbi:uncharacterized protein LOC127282185 [Leptopilina boulardi]|uniref:uncharacterized protein LOC127282185 n=1 Tax=Leptopilina boulardi TaxID=63433 RepID=UPI0021F61079|nr:uncharacterized protein LOC127282185 [Leptopilina boulardi]
MTIGCSREEAKIMIRSENPDPMSEVLPRDDNSYIDSFNDDPAALNEENPTASLNNNPPTSTPVAEFVRMNDDAGQGAKGCSSLSKIAKSVGDSGLSEKLVVVDELSELGLKLSGVMTAESCELYSILSALKFMRASQLSKVIIVSDSRSSLSCIKDRFLGMKPHPTILKIVRITLELINEGRLVQFLWVPSHKGIKGNEIADKLAKEAYKLPIAAVMQTLSVTRKSVLLLGL